ncbi:RidA family protein [Aspergillus puulaauensis]|uniref:YjgF-like protein n=1 Tax=Aspergillus puulaauensis TaxID=1220207 RepID=A0A7R8ASV8_9EURO|nr:uncharacterized protein APUU_61346A [Aspergillus puulaauensis]BCS28298.1 hypothetical protein APUU_61346A [Aspergillus puulaauensis]
MAQSKTDPFQTPLVTTSNPPNTRAHAAHSQLSITPFPPNDPTIAFIRTAPQTSNSTAAARQAILSQDHAHHAFQNLKTTLAAAGATPRDITKLTVYLQTGAHITAEQLDQIIAGFCSDVEGNRHKPPVTVLYVEKVMAEGFAKVAVEAEAIVSLKPPSYESLA